jgi:hypothetical protein
MRDECRKRGGKTTGKKPMTAGSVLRQQSENEATPTGFNATVDCATRLNHRAICLLKTVLRLRLDS